MSELTSSFRNLKKETEPRLKLLSGNLGITLGGNETVNVPDRNGWVYVRLLNNTSELIQAYNGVVTPIYNLPVQVKRNKDRYEIYGRDTLRYQNWGATPYLPLHGNQHSFDRTNGGGGDLVWVHQEQFYPLAPTPTGTSGGNNLLIAPYVYNWFGEWKYTGDLVTPEVLSNRPTGSFSSKLMLLCLEGDTGDYHFIEGDEAPYNFTGIADLIQYLPTYNPAIDIPIAFVRISSGTSSIGWDEIYDVRQFYGREMMTGSSGGSGVDNFLDLTDTPDSYAGKGSYFVKVKSDVSGLEFISGSSSGGIEEAPINGIPYSRQDAGWVISSTGSSGGGHTILEENTPLTQRTKLKFTGAGVTVTDDAGNDQSVVTIPGETEIGDVVGPTGTINGNLAAFDGVTGKLISDSGSKAADFAVAAKGVTNGDSHDHVGGDGATLASATAAAIHAATNNTTPVDADEIGIWDSVAGLLNRLSWANLKARVFPGAWITPAFNAADFTASGAMTWTLQAGDAETYAYQILGNTMIVAFSLNSTTVAGTLSGRLSIKIPNGKTATKTVTYPIYILDNLIRSIGICTVASGATTIDCLRADTANWTASVNQTFIFGQLIFEIN